MGDLSFYILLLFPFTDDGKTKKNLIIFLVEWKKKKVEKSRRRRTRTKKRREKFMDDIKYEVIYLVVDR